MMSRLLSTGGCKLDSAACDIDLEYNYTCDATCGVSSYDANGMSSE